MNGLITKHMIKNLVIRNVSFNSGGFMQRQSLQRIEDFFLALGYEGEKLRRVLEKDKEYQKLLKERRHKLGKKARATSLEKKKYVLSTDEDFEILEKCKKLEKQKLAPQDKKIVKLIKSQLENEWRKPLVQSLNQLLKKYNF